MSKFGGKDPFSHPFFTEPFGGLFGGRSPFDDPFFTRPFGDPFFTGRFGDYAGSRKPIAIEELNPDDDGGDDIWQRHIPGKEVSVKGPNEDLPARQSFSFQRVAYGGPNGPEYSASVGKRTGSDGMVFMEMKEDDKLSGESLHTTSKGIHDKGHSVTKKKSKDGQVDSLQTLHNLNEDELSGFEENWNVNADKVLPGWSNSFNSLESAGTDETGWGNFSNLGGWMFPSLDYYGRDGAIWNGVHDATNWGGWPFPSLEHPGYGGAETNGEPSGPPTQGSSRKVIPIE